LISLHGREKKKRGRITEADWGTKSEKLRTRRDVLGKRVSRDPAGKEVLRKGECHARKGEEGPNGESGQDVKNSPRGFGRSSRGGSVEDLGRRQMESGANKKRKVIEESGSSEGGRVLLKKKKGTICRESHKSVQNWNRERTLSAGEGGIRGRTKGGPGPRERTSRGERIAKKKILRGSLNKCRNEGIHPEKQF